MSTLQLYKDFFSHLLQMYYVLAYENQPAELHADYLFSDNFSLTTSFPNDICFFLLLDVLMVNLTMQFRIISGPYHILAKSSLLTVHCRRSEPLHPECLEFYTTSYYLCLIFDRVSTKYNELPVDECPGSVCSEFMEFPC